MSPDRMGKPLKLAGTGKRPTIGQYLPSSDDHHEPVYFQRADRAVSTLMISHALFLVEALVVELEGFAGPTAVYLQRKTICDHAGLLAAGACWGGGPACAAHGAGLIDVGALLVRVPSKPRLLTHGDLRFSRLFWGA